MKWKKTGSMIMVCLSKESILVAVDPIERQVGWLVGVASLAKKKWVDKNG